MLVNEDGPANIFERLRYRVGVRRSPDNPDFSFAENPDAILPNLFLCVYCMSVWVAIFWSIAVLLHTGVTLILALPFALSAVAILLEDRKF